MTRKTPGPFGIERLNRAYWEMQQTLWLCTDRDQSMDEVATVEALLQAAIYIESSADPAVQYRALAAVWAVLWKQFSNKGWFADPPKALN